MLKLLTHDETRKEELEVPKQRIRMMDGRWMNLREELQVEGEVLMGIMEELRIFPVNGNMPSWTARDLTSRSNISSFFNKSKYTITIYIDRCGTLPASAQSWRPASGRWRRSGSS